MTTTFTPNQWIACTDELPAIGDYSVLAYWSRNGGMDMVHATEYFAPMTNGLDADGKQLMSFWYLHSGVTHWMPMPPAPTTAKVAP